MSWPALPRVGPDRLEFEKTLYQAQVEEESARRQAELKAELDEASARRQAEHQGEIDAEAALNKSVHDGRLEVAQAAIARGQSGAEFVRNAAAAIGTLYTGVLGVTFATAKDATPLPARGLAPAVFLGLALVCASAYAALLTRSPQISAPAPHSQLSVFQERRLNAFIEWVSKIALARVYFLHAGVLSLGFGVLLLPAPFIAVADWLVLLIALLALAVTMSVPRFTTR
jgi:hypothetical protein